MSVSVQNMVKTLIDAVKKTESKTSAYDTPATVRRIEGDTAWVHINGGVDETPVKLTIAANVGDDVQVRVSGGRAFLVGNGTAPPTDDKTAIHARTLASNAQSTAADAQETAETAQSTASGAATIANTAITIAEGTNEHFWNDNTGAHVTQVTQDEWNDSSSPNYHSGGNTLITSEGMAIRDGMTELAVFGASGAQIGQADSSNISLNPSGVSGTGADGAPYFDFNGTSAEITYTIRKELPAVRFDAQTLSTRTQVIDAVYDISEFADVGEVCSIEALYVRFNTEDRILSYSNPVNCTVQNMNSVKVTPGNITIGTDLTINASVTLDLGLTSVTHKLFEEVSFAYSGTDNTISVSVYATITQGGSYNVSGGYETMRYITRQDTVSAPCMTFGTRAGDDDPGGLSSTFGGFLYGTGEYQTALGKFNEQDTNDEYSLIIGNGTADDRRSNALTVDWSGNIEAAGDITDGSSNTLSSVANTVNTYVSNIKVIRQTGTITISAGSTSSPSSTNLSVSSSVGNGTLVGAELLLGQQALPYGTSGTMQTWLWHVENTNKRLVIRNATSAWNNYSYTAILFVIPG